MSELLMSFTGLLIVFLIWLSCYPQLEPDRSQSILYGPSMRRRLRKQARRLKLNASAWNPPARLVVPSLIAIILAAGIRLYY